MRRTTGTGHARRGRRAAASAAAAVLLACLAGAPADAATANPAASPTAASRTAPANPSAANPSAANPSAANPSAANPSAARPGAANSAASPAGIGARSGADHTVVSFTFDDGDSDQMAAARILNSRGIRGTFYVITGAVGTPGYLTLGNLRQLARAGNEIGGHTTSHLDLTQISLAEAKRQVCAGRATLAAWGFRATSFAYPGATFTRTTESVVAGCGFNSARAGSGLDCPGCARADAIPPARPYAIRTPGQADGTWTFDRLRRAVLQAQRSGGGWVPFVFHHVCAASQCGPYAIPASTLATFATWLAGKRGDGITVATVGQVIRRRPQPVVPARAAAPHGATNASLEAMGSSGAVDPNREEADSPGRFPRCWMPGGYGRSTVRWQRTTNAHSGRWAQRLVISNYASGDAKLLQQFDLGECSLPVTPGRAYHLTTWYESTIRTQFSVYYRDRAGRWAYWTSSPYFPAQRSWSQASWQTPPVPAGAAGVSFGLALAGDGSLTTDDYGFAVAARNPFRELAGWALIGAIGVAAAWGGARGLSASLRSARRRRGLKSAQPARREGRSSSTRR